MNDYDYTISPELEKQYIELLKAEQVKEAYSTILIIVLILVICVFSVLGGLALWRVIEAI